MAASLVNSRGDSIEHSLIDDDDDEDEDEIMGIIVIVTVRILKGLPFILAFLAFLLNQWNKIVTHKENHGRTSRESRSIPN
jgi:hypothetical protein